MFPIGDLHLQSKAILSPMTGITDLPYRIINREFGCEFAFTEMINIKGLLYNSKKTLKMIQTEANDSPLGIQILANDEKILQPALEKLQDFPFDVLDFNAACPTKKIVQSGSGAALLKDAKKLQRMLEIIIKHSDKPVTVKIRTGWDTATRNALEIAKRAQDAGVKAVFIHGRTRHQHYIGSVDYGTIREIKNSLDIPVIGSGNIFSPQLAKKMIDETGCDAVLVARGSFGNPWIFSTIENYLKNKTLRPCPGQYDIATVMRKHLDMIIDFYGEFHGACVYRKIFVFYTKYFINSKPLRKKVFFMTKKTQIMELIEKFRHTVQRHEMYFPCSERLVHFKN